MMESAVKSTGSTAAIDLKNELLSVVEAESNPQPQPVQVAPLPIVLTTSIELEEKCANQEIITPPTPKRTQKTVRHRNIHSR